MPNTILATGSERLTLLTTWSTLIKIFISFSFQSIAFSHTHDRPKLPICRAVLFLGLPMIVLNIPIEPVAKGRPRFSRRSGTAYTPEKTRVFERSVKAYAKEQYKKEPLKGALSLTVVFFVKRPKTVTREYPTVKPDTTNFVKGLEDALNGVLWDDDSQIIEVIASKRYADVGSISVDVRHYRSSF